MKITVTHENVKVEIDEACDKTHFSYESHVQNIRQILEAIAHQIRFINDSRVTNWVEKGRSR
jgi:hypothetical protein